MRRIDFGLPGLLILVFVGAPQTSRGVDLVNERGKGECECAW
jgi:hypothetical protein